MADAASLLRAVAWGAGVRPLLRARDLALVRANPAVRAAYLALWRAERALPPHRPSPAGAAAAAGAGLNDATLVWGETPLATAASILAHAGVGQGSTVVDLGAGRGMVLLAARLLGASARGVEIDPLRAEPATAPLARVGAALVVGDARTFPLEGATHVFLSWTCMPDDVRAVLAERVAELGAGVRVVALTWDPPGERFTVLERRLVPFSWGRATAVIAEVTP